MVCPIYDMWNVTWRWTGGWLNNNMSIVMPHLSVALVRFSIVLPMKNAVSITQVWICLELLTLQQNNHAKVHSFLTHHAVRSSSTVCKPWQKSFVYTVSLYCVVRIQLWRWQGVNGNLFIEVVICINRFDLFMFQS